MSFLTEIGAIPPGAQLWSPQIITSTSKYFIYASTHSVFIYNKIPVIEFCHTIVLNNTIICTITASEDKIVIAGNDKKVYFYDLNTFEPIREVILARSDPPISIEFHYHLPDCVILLYQGNEDQMISGELRSINVISGQSFTLISGFESAIEMVCSPHNPEVAILEIDGSIRIYGISESGQISYERNLLEMQLRIFESTPYSNELKDEQSQESTEIIEIINDFRKSIKDRKIECSGFSYDPKSEDYFLVSWNFGIHCLFSSVTGEALQMYEPEPTGILSICYSITASGKFYTTDGESGVLKEWNVSSNKNIHETRLSNPVLLRSYVDLDSQNNEVIFLVTAEGKVVIYSPFEQEVIFETERSHSDAVLDIEIDGDYFSTSSFDSITRQWCIDDFNYKAIIPRTREISFATVRYQEESIEQVVQTNKKKLFINQIGSAIANIYVENIIIVAKDDGLIVAFDKITGRPIVNIFNPTTQYKTSFVDELADITLGETDIIKEKHYELNTKINCITYDNGLVFSGWRDSCIRIMKVSIIKSDKAGYISSSKFMSCVNLCKLLKVATDKDIAVRKMIVVNQLLYCACTCGIFLIFDVSELYGFCENASNEQYSEAECLKETSEFFVNNYFVGNVINTQPGEIYANYLSHLSKVQLDTRYFNSICVTDLTEPEKEFFKGYDQSLPIKLVTLVDNEGNCITMSEIGIEPLQMCFKCINTFSEKYKISEDEMMNFKHIVGYNNVVKLGSFEYCVGGAEGVVKIIDFHTNEEVAELFTTKSNVSCMELYKNYILVGYFDGSIKLISPLVAYEKNIVAILYNTIAANRDFNEEEMIEISAFFGEIYMIEQLNNVLEGKCDLFSPFAPFNPEQIEHRMYLVEYVLLLKISRIVNLKIDDYINEQKEQIESILSMQFESAAELYEFLSLKVENFETYNFIMETNLSKLSELQNDFRLLFTILVFSGQFQLITEILLQLQEYCEAVVVSRYVSLDYYKQVSKSVIYNKLNATNYNLEETVAQRYQLLDIIQHKLSEMKCVFSSVENPNYASTYVQQLLSNKQFIEVKLLISLLKTSDYDARISAEIANYYSVNCQPIFASYELLNCGEFADAIELLMLNSEYTILLFILIKLRQKGFEYDNFIRLVLIELAQQNRLQLQPLVNDIKRDEPADDFELVFSKSVTFNDILDYYTLNYSKERAYSGKQLINNCKNEINPGDVINICHYIRYLIAMESEGKIAPKHDEADKFLDGEVQNDSTEFATIKHEEKQTNEENKNEASDRPEEDKEASESEASSMKQTDKPLFYKEAYKEINYILIKAKIKKEQFIEMSQAFVFLIKHLLLTNCEYYQEYVPLKSPSIARLLLFNAGNCVRLKQSKLYKKFIYQAARSIRKLKLETDELLTEVMNDSNYFDSNAGSFQYELNGRDIFELGERSIYNIFSCINKTMQWGSAMFE